MVVLTNIRKFSILKEDEIVFLTEEIHLLDQRRLEVLDNIYMRLEVIVRINHVVAGLLEALALIKQTYGPTASKIPRKSSDLVTSMLTARFVFLRSIV